MPAKIDIFNAALLLLGTDTIASETEGEAGKIMTARYDMIVDAVLRAHPWNCAMAFVSLGAEGTAPTWGYARQFALPAEPYCLRVWRAEYSDYVFKVVGRKIFTDEAAPFKAEIITRITDPMQLDPMLVEAIAARLAHAVGYKLVPSRPREKQMWETYLEIIAEARSIDGQEGTPEEIEADELTNARL